MFLHEYLPFFYVILKNIITTGIALLNMTILLIIVVVICQQMIITVKLSFIITFKGAVAMSFEFAPRHNK